VRLVSWNVNGIRSAARKGFLDWLSADQPDILCLQETRVQPEQLEPGLCQPPGYHTYWHSAETKGYSGVATFCLQPPAQVQKGFGQPEFDGEGRVLISRHPSFTLVNAYFPSGQRGLERVEFKIRFYDALRTTCRQLEREGHPLILCGDLNTAHQPIDLARPSQNTRTSGFLPEEREALSRWFDDGFIDVFRHLHPTTEKYSWWTYRLNARARNIGWRIDYFLITEALLPHVQEADILNDIQGSDHCPISLRLAACRRENHRGKTPSILSF
jgi:exodeoxyribonuclease-3